MTRSMNRQRQIVALLLVLLLCALALLLRLWQLDHLPPGFHFDESFEGLEAWRILTDPTYRPLFLTGNFGVPPLNSYLNALTFGLWRFFGWPLGPIPMRVTAALVGTVSVAVIYALAHELRRLAPAHQLSRVFPLCAAAVLAMMRWHIHFSRMGIEPIYVPFVWLVAMWLLLRGRRTGQWLAYAGCGLSLAVGMYAYQGAWVIPFLVAASGFMLLVQAIWQERHANTELPNGASPKTGGTALRSLWVGLATTGLVATLCVLPLAWFFWQQPALLLERPAQLSIVGETTSPADSGVVASIWATAKMFGPFGSPGDQDPRRNLPGAPALSIWFAIPFYWGLCLALLRCYRLHNAILLLGLIGLLLPGVFSEYAPHFHRILGAAAPTALLCAVGLDWLWQSRFRVGRAQGPVVQAIARPTWVLPTRVGQGLVILLLIGGGLREAQNYFTRWAALPDLFHAFDVGLWTIGQAIAATPAETPIYLTPRDATHATLAFAWHTRPGSHPPPVTFDGRQIFPLTAGENPVAEQYVVIEHEDFRTRLLLPELFPTALVSNPIDAPNGSRYAQTYIREARSVVARQPQHFLQPDQQPLSIGDGIHLLGYDAQPAPLHAGGVLYVQLYWQTAAVPAHDWTVFVHLLHSNSPSAGASDLQWVAGQDSRPGGGSLPTTRWQAGWQILDEYQVQLPAELSAGQYVVAVGLYQPNGTELPGPGERVILGQVTLE